MSEQDIANLTRSDKFIDCRIQKERLNCEPELNFRKLLYIIIVTTHSLTVVAVGNILPITNCNIVQ